MSHDNSARQFAARVDAALREVPAVTALFRSGNLFSNALAIAAETLGMSDPETASPVGVRFDDTGAVEIDAAIGVQTSVPVGETLRAAHRAVLDEAAAAGYTVGAARLTVVHTRS